MVRYIVDNDGTCGHCRAAPDRDAIDHDRANADMAPGANPAKSGDIGSRTERGHVADFGIVADQRAAVDAYVCSDTDMRGNLHTGRYNAAFAHSAAVGDARPRMNHG